MEVTRRYLFNSPTAWCNELIQYIFGTYIIVSGGAILLVGGHVNVDILYIRLSPKTKAKLDILTSFIFFLFAGVLTYYGSALAWESLITLEHSASTWGPPVYPVKLMLPLGATLLLLQGVAKLIRDILIVVKGEDFSPTPHEKSEAL